MRSGWGLSLLVVAGCADKVVTLSLNMPANATGYDATCISTVDFYTDGPDYPTNGQDYERGQTDLSSHPMTLADVSAAIAGKISLSIPKGGLGFVELYGWNSASGFESRTSELVFYAANPYVGQDTLALDIVPNISCARKSIVVRPLDLIAYQTTKSCATAAVKTGTVFAGTMTQQLITPTNDYWGGLQSGAVAATGATVGTATISASTTMGPTNCLAFSTPGAVSCAVYGAGVCSKGSEFELPVIADAFLTSSQDSSLIGQFGGMLFGAVFTSALAPQPGATVTVDPMLGKVVYVDLDAGATRLVPTGSQVATGASGMFILYTSTVLDVTIAAGGITRKVRMGAIGIDGIGDVAGTAPSTATIVMTASTTP